MPLGQAQAPIPSQRIDVDGFLGLATLVTGVIPPTPLGLAQILPIGRLIAGPGVTGGIHEGFQQDRAISVPAAPIVRDVGGRQCEGVAREIGDRDPGEE